MDDTWRWSQQLWSSLFSEEMPKAAKVAAEAGGRDLDVSIDAAYMTSPSQIPGDDPRDSGISSTWFDGPTLAAG